MMDMPDEVVTSLTDKARRVLPTGWSYTSLDGTVESLEAGTRPKGGVRNYSR